MRVLSGLVLIVCLNLFASAGEVPEIPKPAEIWFPNLPDTIPVRPVVVPAGVPVLKEDQIYVFGSNSDDLLVFTIPEGLVKVTKLEGPVSLRAKFIDGGGKLETRKYTGKDVREVTALAKGRVTLIVVPKGSDSETSARVKVIDVLEPFAPGPPPIDPPVDPPVVTPKASKIIVVICENTVERTVQQGQVIYDKSVQDFVKGTGGSVEVVSSKDPIFVSNNYKQLTDKIGLPAVLVFDANHADPNPPIDKYKLPTSAGDFVTQLRKVVK